MDRFVGADRNRRREPLQPFVRAGRHRLLEQVDLAPRRAPAASPPPAPGPSFRWDRRSASAIGAAARTARIRAAGSLGIDLDLQQRRIRACMRRRLAPSPRACRSPTVIALTSGPGAGPPIMAGDVAPGQPRLQVPQGAIDRVARGARRASSDWSASRPAPCSISGADLPRSRRARSRRFRRSADRERPRRARSRRLRSIVTVTTSAAVFDAARDPERPAQREAIVLGVEGAGHRSSSMMASTPKAIGSVQGRPSRSAVRSQSRARLVRLHARRVEADADRPDVGAGQPRRVEVARRGIRRDRAGRARECRAYASGRARWHSTIASGWAPWSRPSDTPAKEGWKSEPCPSITSQPSSWRAGASCSIAPEMKSATTASTATPSPAIRMPVWPGRPEIGGDAALAKRRVERERRVHLADRAIGADGEQAMARPRNSRCRRPGPAAARGRRRAAGPAPARARRATARRAAAGGGPTATFIPASSADRGIVDEVAAELAAGAGDAEHQGPRAGRDRLGHAQPRQIRASAGNRRAGTRRRNPRGGTWPGRATS